MVERSSRVRWGLVLVLVLGLGLAIGLAVSLAVSLEQQGRQERQLAAQQTELTTLRAERAQAQQRLVGLELNAQQLSSELAALRATAPAASAVANPAEEAGRLQAGTDPGARSMWAQRLAGGDAISKQAQAGRRAQTDAELARLTARLVLSPTQVRDVGLLLQAESAHNTQQAARLLRGQLPTQALQQWDQGFTAVQAQIRNLLTDTQRVQFDADRQLDNNRLAAKNAAQAVASPEVSVPSPSLTGQPSSQTMNQQQLANILASLKGAAASAPAADKSDAARP